MPSKNYMLLLLQWECVGILDDCECQENKNPPPTKIKLYCTRTVLVLYTVYTVSKLCDFNMKHICYLQYAEMIEHIECTAVPATYV